MTTEAEAKTKWCPFAHFYRNSLGEQRSNRTTNMPRQEDTRCIASECMAWRWSASVFYEESGETVHGYCGLAGKP